MNQKSINLLGYQIIDDYPQLSETQQVVNTINAHSFCVAVNDPEFETALKKSTILLPDGVGITFAAKFLNGDQISKIAGADVHQHCLEVAARDNKKVFYLGASNSTLDKIKEKLLVTYPELEVGTFSPPYKAKFSDNDNRQMIDAVNAFNPQFLFVGMTAPKQEKWVQENRKHLDAKVICSIGAVFDFYAGNVKRPSPIWVKLKLEWLIRLLKEPRRLAKRHFTSIPKFIWYIFKAKITGKTK